MAIILPEAKILPSSEAKILPGGRARSCPGDKAKKLFYSYTEILIDQ